jgi:hypothetical protein
MMIAQLAELLALAQGCFDAAKQAAKEIHLSESAQFSEITKNREKFGARLLATEPGYAEIKPFSGMKAWGALLSFDLRKSTARALELGPRDTYLTMHTYLPTMLRIIEGAGGLVVGLRGDGAIACFGIIDLTNEEVRVTSKEAEKAVRAASDCGHAMVDAIDAVVNRVLRNSGVKGGLLVGVGIDVGQIVATNIGLDGARDLTAYGNCVNTCCKRSCGNNLVILTLEAKKMFPKGKGGRTKFARYKGKDDHFILHYPGDYKTLG